MVTSLATKPDHQQAIGLIMAEFAAMEHGMMMVLSCLLGCGWEKTGALFAAVESARSRREMVAEVGRIALKNHPDELRRLERLVKRSAKATSKRNTYAHALWSVGKGGDTGIQNSLGAPGSTPVRIKDLKRIPTDLGSLSNDWMMFLFDLWKLRS